MIDPAQIIPHLDVVAMDGTKVGTVDHLDGDRIKLARNTAPDGQHHFIPLTWVDHVDAHVHLNMPPAAVFAGWPGYHGTAPVAKKTPNWIAWGALIAGLLALLLFALRGCDHKSTVTTTTSEAVTTTTFNDDVKTFLASAAPAPKTFVFDKLNFDTASSAIRPDDQPTVDVLAQTLTAYPKAKVRLVGYTDSRPVAGGNAQLGAERAAAVAKALEAKGVAADRVETATGADTAPTASNATPAGQAENRRTELVITAK